MKKFKLIKEYPGSPNLGTICEERNNKSSFCYYFEREKNIGITKDQVENQPEYWEEVIENSFEILSFKQDSGITDLWTLFREGWSRNINGYPVTGPYTTEAILNNKLYNIHSVKRLSDGEVFTIGDRAMTEGSRGSHTIRQFRLRHKCIGKDSTGTYLYGDLDRIWIDWEAGCGGNWLESTVKIKQPIFLTHDGKDIFDGKRIWYVNKENFYYDYIITHSEVKFNSDLNAYFLTRQEAEDYIEKSKVLFTTEDGVDLKHGDSYYFVDTDFNINTSKANFQAVAMSDKKKYFATSAAAENYLVQKSHSLSIEDFWEFVCWGGSNIAKSKRLKRLVKDRLGIK